MQPKLNKNYIFKDYYFLIWEEIEENKPKPKSFTIFKFIMMMPLVFKEQFEIVFYRFLSLTPIEALLPGVIDVQAKIFLNEQRLVKNLPVTQYTSDGQIRSLNVLKHS